MLYCQKGIAPSQKTPSTRSRDKLQHMTIKV